MGVPKSKAEIIDILYVAMCHSTDKRIAGHSYDGDGDSASLIIDTDDGGSWLISSADVRDVLEEPDDGE